MDRIEDAKAEFDHQVASLWEDHWQEVDSLRVEVDCKVALLTQSHSKIDKR